MDKKLSLKIGEKEVVLNFGVNWFFEFYKNDSGHDLVKDPGLDLMDLKSTQLFSYLKSMIWAGYQSECAINKTPLELTKGDVEDFVMSGTENAAVELMWAITACGSGVTVDELKELSVEKKN
jgi:hypothetical protein